MRNGNRRRREEAAYDGRAANSAEGDLRPPAELARSVGRYGLVVLIAALLVAGGVLLTAMVSAQAHTAAARVSLTERVIWPFYDTERYRLVDMAAAPPFRQAVSGQLPPGGTLEALRVDMPVDQAFVVVVATANDDAAALAAADAAATMLAAESQRRLEGQSRLQLEEAERGLATVNASIADLTAQMAAVRSSSDAYQSLSQRRTAEYDRLKVFQDARDRAAVDLASDASPTVEVLQPAQLTGAGISDSVRNAVLAALVTALLGVGVAIFFDCRYARIRGTRHARAGAARGLPVLDVGGTDPATAASRLRAARQLIGLHHGGEAVGVASAPHGDDAQVVRDLVDEIRAGGGSVVTMGAEEHSSAGPTFALSRYTNGGERSPSTAIDQVADLVDRSGGAHLQVDLRGPAPRATVVRPLLRRLVDTVDLVVLHLGPVGAGEQHWPSVPLGTPAQVIVVAASGRTTQGDLRRAMESAAQHDAEILAVVLQTPNENAGGVDDGPYAPKPADGAVETGAGEETAVAATGAPSGSPPRWGGVLQRFRTT